MHQINQSWNEKISIEDLNHLNFALGSCGEFHSFYVSFKQAGQISDDDYEQLDKLHYKAKNELLKLIESLQGTTIRLGVPWLSPGRAYPRNL